MLIYCFYFNVTCSKKKKKLNKLISIYDAYREKDLKSNLVQI